MCLIFESCLSGGLVDKDENLSLLVNSKDEKEFDVLDVNDENRVIIMSSHPNTLSKVSFIFGFPMTYCLSRAFDGKARDRDKDGFISVEEAFKFARPRAIFCSSLFWLGSFGMDVIIGLLVGVPNPIELAIGSLIWSFIFNQLFIKILTGKYVLNWPNIHDEYDGNLPIIKCQ